MYSISVNGAPQNVSVHPITNSWEEGIENANLGTSNWFYRSGDIDEYIDFEATNGGLVGTNDWEWGTFGPFVGVNDPNPPVPPASAYSGTNMWGTVLNSNYNNLGATSVLTYTVDLNSSLNQSGNIPFRSLDHPRISRKAG